MTSSNILCPILCGEKGGKEEIDQTLSLGEVKGRTLRAELAAEPVQSGDSTSPWLTGPKKALSGIRKVLGQSEYTANLGCHTWLSGVYWINVLEDLPMANC